MEITQQGTNGIATVVDADVNQVRVLYTANAGTAGMTDSFKFQGTSSGGEPGNEVTMNTNNVANTDDVPVCQGNHFLTYVAGVATTAGSCSDPDAGDVLDVTITQQGDQRHGGRRRRQHRSPARGVHREQHASRRTQFKFQATDGTDPKSSLITVNTQNLPAPPPDRPPECDFFADGLLSLEAPATVGACFDDNSPPRSHLDHRAGTKGVVRSIHNHTEIPA